MEELDKKRFPDGKLMPQDEGTLEITIGVIDKRVVLDFGKSITWLGCAPAFARKVAEILIQKANEAEEGPLQ